MSCISQSGEIITEFSCANTQHLSAIGLLTCIGIGIAIVCWFVWVTIKIKTWSD